MTYKYVRKWRKSNRTKRNGQRKRNYQRTRENGSAKSMKHWTPWKLAWLFLMSGRRSDQELSQLLGRSVQSIQSARWRWKERVSCKHKIA